MHQIPSDEMLLLSDEMVVIMVLVLIDEMSLLCDEVVVFELPICDDEIYISIDEFEMVHEILFLLMIQ